MGHQDSLPHLPKEGRYGAPRQPSTFVEGWQIWGTRSGDPCREERRLEVSRVDMEPEAAGAARATEGNLAGAAGAEELDEVLSMGAQRGCGSAELAGDGGSVDV